MKSAVKKRRAKSTCSANAIAPGRTSFPPATGRGQLYQRQPRGGAGAYGDGDRHGDPDLRRHGGARHPGAGLLPGCASLSRPWSAGSAPPVTSAEKMRSTVTALSSDVNSSIDFVLEGHQRVCEVLSRADNRAAVAQAVALLSDARQVGIFGIGASGILAEYTARLFSRIGLPAYVMNRTGFSLAEQLIGLQRGDVLIMMGQNPPIAKG